MFSKTATIAVLLVFPILGFHAAYGQSAPPLTTAADLYKKASPSVVLIEIYDSKGEVSGKGSGFLVSPEGAILTNYHVIAHTGDSDEVDRGSGLMVISVPGLL